MGLLDNLMKGSGGLAGIADLVAKNPQLVAAAVSMLSTRDASVGGTGGLGGLISAFQKGGLGDVMSQWISTGPNPSISADQLTKVLGSDVIGQIAQKAGLGHAEAGSALAAVLPSLIDHLTPNGQVPDTNALEGTLGSLLSSLGR
ncbi:MAG TPA: YidB family protein [Vicinamibacteria bacterium]|nr:YidB family protein [Vicinamibacteria bacterium]